MTLPAPLATALDLVWSAARPELLRILALQAASAIGLATQLVLARGLLQLFVGETTHGPLATGDLGLLAAFAAATALAGFAAAALPEQVVLVAELVSRRATDQVIDVACAVEAAEFASPSFQDQLERVRSHGVLQPWRLTSGLLTSMHSLLGLLGIGVAIASVAVWLLPLALLAWVPIWMVARHSTKVGWRQVMQGATDERVRAQFVHVFLSQESAHEVRAFDLRRSLRPRFAELLDRRIERLRHVARHRVRAALATSGIGALAVAGGVGLLAWLVATDHLEVAQAGVAAVAVQQLGSRLRSGRGALAALRECRPYLDDLAALMARAPAAAAGVQDAVGPTLDDVVAAPRSPTPGRRRAGSEPPRVTLDRVDFTYPGASAPALHDLSLTIEPGETLALVGHNGSGKSTLTRLLAGLYAPTGGRILWDGVDVSRLEPGQIRDQVAVLFQDFVRYPFSAQINVGVGRPEHLDDADAIRVAASLAGIRERVEALPRGWDTPLMRSLEGGADLSIGEWQRLSLARAFLRDAPLVLLDEPTAAVDPETEAALLEAIFTHGRGRSLVLISHRLSSVRRADRIVVLAHGRIVECGGHEELLARGGLYATLFETQAAGYRDTPEVRRAAGA